MNHQTSSPFFLIRAGNPGDAAALARLRYEFRSTENPATEGEAAFLERCEAWMAARLAPGSSWRCWVAEEAGRIVGAIWLQILEKIPNPGAEAERHGYISNFYIEPARRGAGLGTKMLDACLRFCEEEAAVDAVILWPTARSRGLYERRGFAVREDLLERRAPS